MNWKARIKRRVKCFEAFPQAHDTEMVFTKEFLPCCEETTFEARIHGNLIFTFLNEEEMRETYEVFRKSFPGMKLSYLGA